MSRRILQPGEIEALDNTTFPRVLPPHIGSLFLERAARLRQLASGNPIADYLEFAAHIVSAQHQAAQALPPPAIERSAMQHAQAHGMPLFAAAEQLDTGLHDWQQTLEHILNTLASQTTGLPEALQPLIAELRTIAMTQRLIDEGKLQRAGTWQAPKIHAILADSWLGELSMKSKFDTEWSFLSSLKTAGREAASQWIDACFVDVGKRTSVDLQEVFL